MEFQLGMRNGHDTVARDVTGLVKVRATTSGVGGPASIPLPGVLSA
jgi:hypothetical protein